MKAFCEKTVNHALFEKTIIGVILLNGVILGLETSSQLVEQYGSIMKMTSHVILLAFILEALMKIIADAPQVGRYFGSGWNVFDFSVVIF